MTATLNQGLSLSRSLAPLLNTESAEDFETLRNELRMEIKPKGPIEQIYVDDFAALLWEILRYRRYKVVMIDDARLAALLGILQQLLSDDDYEFPHLKETEAENLARSWFYDKKAQTRVAELLRKFQMDEMAIEVEAFRLRAGDLDRLERISATLEIRRDRNLRSVAEYRQHLSKQLREAGDRIVENDDVPFLVASSRRLR
jgi:hypothetical protein